MFRKSGWSLAELQEQVAEAPDELLVSKLWHDWSGGYDGTVGLAGNIWLTAFWEPEEKEQMLSFYTSDRLHNRFSDLALNDDLP
jgi:hypothetical protein